MNYFISKPINVETIDPAIYEAIIENHGSYDDFNGKIEAGCNTADMIQRFEEVMGESCAKFTDIKITLYSGIEQQEILSGMQTAFEPSEIAAMATKVHGIAYIAFDMDLLMMNPEDYSDSILCSMVGNVLGHELVHYNQMERGDLDITNEGLVWKGMVYTHGELQAQLADIRSSSQTTDEFQFRLVQSQVELPWEFEAYGTMLQHMNIDTAYPAPHWHELMTDIKIRFAKKGTECAHS